MTRRTARLALAALLLCALAAAGCAGEAPATTRIEVRFAGHAQDVAADVESALSSRPALDRYRADRIPHPDAYTAHDQLEDWSRATGTPYEATPFNGSFGAGYFLASIAGVAADGATAYWALSINGAPSDVGMSEAALAAGDTVAWTYTRIEAAAGDGNGSLGLRVDPVQPTQEDAVVLTGSLGRDATVAVRGGPSTEAKAGAWSLRVPLGHGQTRLAVVADDGAQSQSADVVAVRLASATFEALYTASPGHGDTRDTVWYDPDAMLSAPLYAEKGAARPQAATVHDVMVAWTAQTGRPVEYGYSDSFGFSVVRIDGVGQPLDSSLPPYWCYKIDGESADLGITLQEVQPGATITWEYGACA